MQLPCAYGPCKTFSLDLSWQVKHSSFAGETRLMNVASFSFFTVWQVVHPIAIAECTYFPLPLSSWHSMHLAGSGFFPKGTGCSVACAPTRSTTKHRTEATMHLAEWEIPPPNDRTRPSNAPVGGMESVLKCRHEWRTAGSSAEATDTR